MEPPGLRNRTAVETDDARLRPERTTEVIVHRVAPSDTLAGVALRYHVKASVLRRYNRLWPQDSVQMRKTLYIPLFESSSTATSSPHLSLGGERDEGFFSPPEQDASAASTTHIPSSELAYFPPPSHDSPTSPSKSSMPRLPPAPPASDAPSGSSLITDFLPPWPSIVSAVSAAQNSLPFDFDDIAWITSRRHPDPKDKGKMDVKNSPPPLVRRAKSTPLEASQTGRPRQRDNHGIDPNDDQPDGPNLDPSLARKPSAFLLRPMSATSYRQRDMNTERDTRWPHTSSTP